MCPYLLSTNVWMFVLKGGGFGKMPDFENA